MKSKKSAMKSKKFLSFNSFGKKIYKTEQCATGQVYVREADWPEGNFEFTTCPGTINSVGKYSIK